MNSQRLRIVAVAATALSMAGALLSSANALPTSGSRTAVCAGVQRCHRVAVIDVDGDRRADRIGWRRLGDAHAQVRVRTADGEALARKIDVRYWPGGGVWGDAAWIDGRPGAELLAGSVMGAHTPQYTMLTYRKGRLVIERSPGDRIDRGRWMVDSALMIHAGWHRDVGPRGRVTITERDALRTGEGKRFRGHDVRYAWRGGRWVRVDSTARTYRGNRQARSIGGWHVGHLERWPGLR